MSHYLDQLRRGLFGNLVKGIVRTDGMNKVYFTVGNLTDDPVAGVQFTVVVPRANLLVFTSSPADVDQLPPLPKWPDDFQDKFRDQVANVAISAVARDYDLFDPHAGSVSSTSEEFEVTWEVGDLRPGEWSRDLAITVIPGPDAPEDIPITMTAAAMNRHRRVTETAALTISSEVVTPDYFYVAEPDD